MKSYTDHCADVSASQGVFNPRKVYEDYIHSDHWSDLRLRVFNKANRRCEACNLPKKNLQGHHLNYRNLIDCTEDDIMALCQTCHELWHQFHSSHVVADRETVVIFLEEKRNHPPAVVVGFKNKAPSPPKPKPADKNQNRSPSWHKKHQAKVARRKSNKAYRKAWCDFNRKPVSKESLAEFISRLQDLYNRL